MMDLPVKACHGWDGVCQASYNLNEWKQLKKVGEKGAEEVRSCCRCGELLFLETRGLERMNLSVDRETYREMHPGSDRLDGPSVYTVKG